MDKARQAVSEFVGHGGKHKTTVNESVAPAVTDEHIRPHKHENVTTAVDREVHQDHHHTTVQPIAHKETLPEEHSHRALPVEHKTFEHGNESEVRDKLDREKAKFQNNSVTHDTTQSSSVAPTVEAERVHHHVHEHVQPVINKETVAPKVIHTTVPVHETHHASAQHHGTSTLPTKTIDEFTSSGGILDGKGAHHHGEYDGCPRPYNSSLQNEQLEGDRDMHHHSHGSDHHHHDQGTTGLSGRGNNSTNTGSHSGQIGNDFESRGNIDANRRGVAGDGLGSNNSGLGSNNSGLGSNNSGLGSTNSNSTATGTGHQGKPSLMDKLNPKKDADGDGKAGFLH